MPRERLLPAQKQHSLAGRRLSHSSLGSGKTRPVAGEEVPWVVLMEQISKANGTRRSNYVAKVLPDWKYNATARDPEDMSEDSEELPRPKGKADAKEKAAKRLPRRLAPSLEGCRWTTWSHVSRPFTPNNEVGTLMPLQFNLWEEKRIFSPNRSWPTRPKNPKVAAAPQFYDQQREGLPFWKAVTWKHQGQIFSDPPPFKKRPRSAAQRRVAALEEERPSSAQGKAVHPNARRESLDLNAQVSGFERLISIESQ